MVTDLVFPVGESGVFGPVRRYAERYGVLLPTDGLAIGDCLLIRSGLLIGDVRRTTTLS